MFRISSTIKGINIIRAISVMSTCRVVKVFVLLSLIEDLRISRVSRVIRYIRDIKILRVIRGSSGIKIFFVLDEKCSYKFSCLKKNHAYMRAPHTLTYAHTHMHTGEGGRTHVPCTQHR